MKPALAAVSEPCDPPIEVVAIARHLAVPYGGLPQAGSIKALLRSGTLTTIEDGKERGICARLFNETGLDALLAAVAVCDVSLAVLEALYQETLAHGAARVPAWEDFARRML